MRPTTVFGIFTNLVPRVCVTFVQQNGQRELWERGIDGFALLYLQTLSRLFDLV